jgi:hypothetical protein
MRGIKMNIRSKMLIVLAIMLIASVITAQEKDVNIDINISKIKENVSKALDKIDIDKIKESVSNALESVSRYLDNLDSYLDEFDKLDLSKANEILSVISEINKSDLPESEKASQLEKIIKEYFPDANVYIRTETKPRPKE